MGRVFYPGNRIYIAYHIFGWNGGDIKVIAKNMQHARKLIMKRFKPTTEFSLSWDIYDGNHGITTLPIGSIIYSRRQRNEY